MASNYDEIQRLRDLFHAKLRELQNAKDENKRLNAEQLRVQSHAEQVEQQFQYISAQRDEKIESLKRLGGQMSRSKQIQEQTAVVESEMPNLQKKLTDEIEVLTQKKDEKLAQFHQKAEEATHHLQRFEADQRHGRSEKLHELRQKESDTRHLLVQAKNELYDFNNWALEDLTKLKQQLEDELQLEETGFTRELYGSKGMLSLRKKDLNDELKRMEAEMYEEEGYLQDEIEQMKDKLAKLNFLIGEKEPSERTGASDEVPDQDDDEDEEFDSDEESGLELLEAPRDIPDRRRLGAAPTRHGRYPLDAVRSMTMGEFMRETRGEQTPVGAEAGDAVQRNADRANHQTDREENRASARVEESPTRRVRFDLPPARNLIDLNDIFEPDERRIPVTPQEVMQSDAGQGDTQRNRREAFSLILDSDDDEAF